MTKIILQSKEYCWKLDYLKDLHSKWATAVALHRNKELTLIQSIEYEYSKGNRTEKESEISRSIYFFCCPLENDEAALDCGRNLIERMGDFDHIGSMTYKTEEETNLVMAASKHEAAVRDTSVER